MKYERRKAGKAELEEGEELQLECPFCGEYFDDITSHIQSCEFAPDDASIEDIVSSKTRKKKKRKPGKSKPTKSGETDEEEDKESSESKKCPYCGKEFQRLGRHLNSCKKKPKEKKVKDKEEEDEEEDEDIDDEEDEDEDEDEEEEDFDEDF